MNHTEYMREWRARPENRESLRATHARYYAKIADERNARGREERAARRPSPESRFWAKVDKSAECWIWTGALSGRPGLLYGSTRWQGGFDMAHRVAYELLVGPIPEGLQLDHLCRNPRCVNPAHLEPVTNAENCRRGREARAALRMATDHVR